MSEGLSSPPTGHVWWRIMPNEPGQLPKYAYAHTAFAAAAAFGLTLTQCSVRILKP